MASLREESNKLDQRIQQYQQKTTAEITNNGYKGGIKRDALLTQLEKNKQTFHDRVKDFLGLISGQGENIVKAAVELVGSVSHVDGRKNVEEDTRAILEVKFESLNNLLHQATQTIESCISAI